MKGMKHFILCHGWGFDPSFWDPVTPLLEPFGHITHWDLGYFDDETQGSCPILGIPDHLERRQTKNRATGLAYETHAPHPNGEELIGIGHSFGLIQLLKHPHDFQQIIGIEAFLSLHDYRESALHLLELMKMNPKKGLEAFYRLCRVESSISCLERINPQRLISDLQAMIEPIASINPHNVLHFSDAILTDQDPIVPFDMAQKQFALMTPHVKINQHRGHGHGNLDAIAPMLLQRVTGSKI